MVGAITMILWGRIAVEPIAPYGSNGGAYIEHGGRVGIALQVSRVFRGEGLAEGESFLGSLDGAFPPMLHVTALPLTYLFDGDVAPVAAFGIVWLLLMALAVGRVALLVGGRPAVGVAVAAAVLAIPGLHGSATRYYFDLPMSALAWASIAILMSGWETRPVRAGLLGGFLGVVACLTKWTALPFLGLMVLGAMFTAQAAEAPPDQGVTSSWRPRIRGKAVATYVAVMGLCLGGYLANVGGHNSLLFTAQESSVESLRDEGGGLLDAVASMIPTVLEGDPERLFRLGGHLKGLAFAVFSPLLMLATLALLSLWLLRSRRGWPLILSTVVGQLAFLVIWIRPVDERFLLALAPALVVGAGLGWGCLSPRLRRPLGGVLFAVGLLIAVDFHHLPSTGATTLWSDLDVWGPQLSSYPPPPRPAGLGASTSAQGRGWVRRDSAIPHRSALRSAILGRLESCEVEAFAAIDASDFVTPEGSHDWLGFEMLLRQLRDPRREFVTVHNLAWEPAPGTESTPFFSRPYVCGDDPMLPPASILFAGLSGSGKPEPPKCPAEATWRLLGVVPDPDGGLGVALWNPFGVDPCAPNAPKAFGTPAEAL